MNPLDARVDKEAKSCSTQGKSSVGAIDDSKGGIVKLEKQQLSTEDQEALRELQKDIAVNGSSEVRVHVAPILMREGSKKAREGSAPDANKDMFDRVPVE